MQVATDMLPGSTERVVTITGGATSISNCVTEVCSIMLEVSSFLHIFLLF